MNLLFGQSEETESGIKFCLFSSPPYSSFQLTIYDYDEKAEFPTGYIGIMPHYNTK